MSSIDLPPTLLDAAGLPVPEEMQGRPLLPHLRGAADWPGEVFVQISESYVGRGVRTQRWKYGVAAPDADGWRDAGAGHYVEDCLYDLHADPDELTNLAGMASHRDVADVMRERLLRRMEEAGEGKPVIESAPPRPSGQFRVSAEEALL